MLFLWSYPQLPRATAGLTQAGISRMLMIYPAKPPVMLLGEERRYTSGNTAKPHPSTLLLSMLLSPPGRAS